VGKFKDLWNGEHRSFVRYAVILTAAFIIFVGFIKRDSLLRWTKSGIELKSLKQQEKYLREEIERMDGQIREISHDKDSLEEYARENFGFARPGDDVYLTE